MRRILCLVAVLGLVACQSQVPTGSPPVVQPNIGEIAASLASVAVDAAMQESLKPGATRATIVEAGYNAALQQAVVLAPQLVADQAWGQAIRTAITLALVLSKDKASPGFILNESKAKIECQNATEKHLR